MRILLIGEYSRLHNSLKEGLNFLGHEVTIVADGDGFKQFPTDYSIDAVWSANRLFNIPRQIVFRLFKYDISKIERGIRFYLLLNKLKGYDVVQLINEAPISTTPAFEKLLLSKLFKQSKKIFLLSCGIDYINVQYMLNKKLKYSLMDPYFDNTALINDYRYLFGYTTKAHKKLHDFVFSKINGVIASDIDYVLPLQNHPKFIGLLPNPVNSNTTGYTASTVNDTIVIFLGINRWNHNLKGIAFFEKALEIIQNKYPDKIEVIITENVPYAQYITLYNKAHIVLDQVYSYDQGYNALEAMAKGKVVFTGAETEFMEYYNLTERVAVNAVPNVTAIVFELSFLIENPDEITAMGRRAADFVEKHHNYIAVAKKYLEVWSK